MSEKLSKEEIPVDLDEAVPKEFRDGIHNLDFIIRFGKLRNFIIYFASFKKTMFFTWLGALGVAYFLLAFVFLPKYTASIKFFVTDDYALSPDLMANPENELHAGRDQKQAEMLNLVNFGESDEVINLVIDQFDLVGRYEFREVEDGHRKAAEQFLEGFDMSFSMDNQVTISVRDKDRMLAMEMCELVLEKISQMNNDYYLGMVNGQQRVFTSQLSFFEQKKMKLEDSLKLIKGKLGPDYLLAENIPGQLTEDLSQRDRDVIKYHNATIHLMEEIGKVDEKLGFFQNEVFGNLQIMEFLGNRELLVLNKRIPPLITNWYWRTFGYALIASILPVLIFAWCIYLYFTYQGYFQVIFNKDNWGKAKQ